MFVLNQMCVSRLKVNRFIFHRQPTVAEVYNREKVKDQLIHVM